LKRLAASVGLLLTVLAYPAAAEVEPALSAEVGSPLKLSANLGIWVGGVAKDGPDRGRGFLVQVQPGLGGGAFNLGWAPVALPSWGTQAVGLAIKARFLRTWGDPWGGLEPDQNYVGGEIALAWILKVSFGVLTRVSSGEGKKTVITWSVGVGL
jgi:hypothetical protein